MKPLISPRHSVKFIDNNKVYVTKTVTGDEVIVPDIFIEIFKKRQQEYRRKLSGGT